MLLDSSNQTKKSFIAGVSATIYLQQVNMIS
jgi:hypothetical protein